MMDDRYEQALEGKKKSDAHYRRSKKGRASTRNWNQSRKARTADKKYFHSEKGQSALLRYNLSPKGNLAAAKRRLYADCHRWLEANPGKTVEDFLAVLLAAEPTPKKKKEE